MTSYQPIAVLGAGLRLPGGIDSLPGLWAHLLAGTPLVGKHPRGRDRGGYLEDIESFDPAPFGLGATESAQMDPQQRILLETTWDALTDSGLPWDGLRGRDVGVFVGAYAGDWLAAQTRDNGGFDAYSGAGASHAVLANRMSYLLDVTGPSMAVDTACSSSLVALHLACQSLIAGECEMAIVAGVALAFDPAVRAMTRASLPFSATHQCRPFDARADGIVSGEGVISLVLQPAGRAAGEGRRTRAVIRGSAVNHDGRTNGLTAPSPRAQEAVLRSALRRSGLTADKVGYVEAHGTGTILGDPIEARAITRVYGSAEHRTYVGSIKSSLGHLEAAAGLAGFLKALLVLSHRTVPAQVGFDSLNPAVTFDPARLAVPTESVPLAPATAAAVSSFGFGGANAHVVLDAVPPRAEAEHVARRAEGAPSSTRDDISRDGAQPEILALSAATPGALAQMRAVYRERAARLDDSALADLARTATGSVQSFPYRAAWAASDASSLRRAVLDEPGFAGDGRVRAGARRGCVLVFTGQGSSWPAMGASLYGIGELAEHLAGWEAHVRRLTGWSLRERLEGFTAESDTLTAQLCIGAVQLAMLHLLLARGVHVAALVGHSMGEAAAGVAAGMYGAESALAILVARARAIESAGRGAMLSVDLSEEAAQELCARHTHGGLGVAAVNAPGSVVISGTTAEVEGVESALRATGTRQRRLPVAYAFHSPLLRGTADLVQDSLATLDAGTPHRPVYSTVTARRFDTPPDGSYWASNVQGTVRFADAFVTALEETGSEVAVEVGPRAVLASAMEASAAAAGRSVQVLSVGARGRPLAESVGGLIADLHRTGVAFSRQAVTAEPTTHVGLPNYPWDRVAFRAPGHDGTGSEGSPKRTTPRDPRPSTAPPPTRPVSADVLSEFIREHVADLLDGVEVGEVERDRPLREWDIESIEVVNLRHRIERTFGVAAPLPILLRGGPPIEIARELLGEPADDVAAILGGLDDLTDAEVRRLLDDLDPEGAVER